MHHPLNGAVRSEAHLLVGVPPASTPEPLATVANFLAQLQPPSTLPLHQQGQANNQFLRRCLMWVAARALSPLDVVALFGTRLLLEVLVEVVLLLVGVARGLLVLAGGEEICSAVHGATPLPPSDIEAAAS
jgi:hypothetical protein